jgi:stress-induced morphogen
MPMAATDIETLIRQGLPDATVEITDLAGDGDHYAARVTSAAFRGMPRVKQHQAVYAALGGRMGGVLHALQLTTAVPEE